MVKKSVLIQIGVVLAVAFVLAAVVYKSKSGEKAKKALEEEPDLLSRASALAIGSPTAKVHIVEFMDPGCETCAAFHPFTKKLVADSGGKVRLSVRYLPLHEGADTMVKILEASRAQGLYWETLELMFAAQGIWASHHHPEPDKIWPLLPRVGVDVEAIRRDMNAPAIAAILEKDLEVARTLGIRKTPSFFVNGEPLRDFGYDQLKALVDRAVAAAY